MLNYTFDYVLFVHDFNNEYSDGATITSTFLYHLGLMVEPFLIYLWFYIGKFSKFERYIFASIIPYQLKDCIDVVLFNNQTPIEFEAIGIIIVVTIGILWAMMKPLKSN